MAYKMYRFWYSCYISTITSYVIEYESRTRWGTSISLDLFMSLVDESANKNLFSMQLYVNIVHFSKLVQAVLKHVPLERWIQLMIGGFKTVSLAWVNKIAMIGYTWPSVYESARRYEGRLNAAPGEPPSQLSCLEVWCCAGDIPGLLLENSKCRKLRKQKNT